MIEIIGMEDNYRPLPSNLTIKLSDIEGFGIFAIDDIKKQTNLGLSHLILDEEIIRTPLGGFINHSDKPNCFIVIIGNESELYSIRPINESEELTVYYSLEQPSRERH